MTRARRVAKSAPARALAGAHPDDWTQASCEACGAPLVAIGVGTPLLLPEPHREPGVEILCGECKEARGTSEALLQIIGARR